MTSTSSTCCIFIGSTGCGKSLLIRNMCNNPSKIKVGHTHKSTTKDIQIIGHKQNSSLLLMDTMGCEDTDEDWTDTQILREITTKLANSKAPKIKVIWCVKPNNRSTPNLRKQAQFINALVNKNWGAVQIIVQKGADESSSQGALGAVKEKTGISYNLPVFDIHCLDMIKNVKSNPNYIGMLNLNKETRFKFGRIYTSEICEIVTNLINKLSEAKANLKKHYNHKTSGKLVPVLVHRGSKVQKYRHKGRIIREYQHDGYLIERQGHKSLCESRKTRKYKHRGNPIGKYYHKPGAYVKQNTYTQTECPFHGTSCTMEYWYYHSSSWVSTWQCYKCGNEIYSGQHLYHCNSYCDRGGSSHGPAVVCCDGMICINCTKKSYTEYYWSCCQNEESDSGCKYKRINSGCKCDENSTGCTFDGYKYPCGKQKCKKKYTKCGCMEGTRPNSNCKVKQEKCSGCNKDIRQRGCDDISYYSTCKHLVSNKHPCHVKERRWSCCNTLENTKLNKKCGSWKWVPKDFN